MELQAKIEVLGEKPDTAPVLSTINHTWTAMGLSRVSAVRSQLLNHSIHDQVQGKN